jgi:PhzF family phenazine biosynthesis protein
MAISERRYRVVDVFTDTPFLGNPVAVVLDGDGLSDAQMQAIASWTNLSETTFVLPPTRKGTDYRLRIFTPRSELPFAGHPTLGTAHALIETGLIIPRNGALVQECETGLVPITVTGDGPDKVLAFDLPFPVPRDLDAIEATGLSEVLGKTGTLDTAMLVDVGARWVVAELADADAVLRLKPDLLACAAYEDEMLITGVTVFGQKPEGGVEVRSFAPGDGIPEDPVCGSGNGAVAVYRQDRGQLKPRDGYEATQGRCVGRDGRIRIAVTPTTIHVGGQAVTTISGTLSC